MTFPDRRKVLMVEDDPIAQVIWKRMIESVDPHAVIVWASTAEDAALLIDRRKELDDAFHFVVTDISLNGPKNGIDLWRTHGLIGTPFLFASSIDVAEFQKLAHRRPTHATPHLVSKPLNAGECMEMFRVLMTRYEEDQEK